jgi:hypothetical protein
MIPCLRESFVSISLALSVVFHCLDFSALFLGANSDAPQIGLVTAERDRLVAEYSLCAAVGRLDAQGLSLSVPYYDPTEHFNNVKNKWAGLTPPPPWGF